MSIDDHDRLMAYVLGLSHALNLAFFTALAESGELVPRLQKMSSTTFDAQLRVASLVATDNPHLYFDIQTLNDYGAASLKALRAAIERIQQARRNGRQGRVRGAHGGRAPLSRETHLAFAATPTPRFWHRGSPPSATWVTGSMCALWNPCRGYERIDRPWTSSMSKGFRANVGIILTDGGGRVLIAGRRGRGGWQFPQGGIHPEESAEGRAVPRATRGGGARAERRRDHRLDRRLAALSLAGPLHPPREDAAVHRPETTLVSASYDVRGASACASISAPSPNSIVVAGWTTGGRSKRSSISSVPCTCARCTSSARSRSPTTARRRRPRGGRVAGSER